MPPKSSKASKRTKRVKNVAPSQIVIPKPRPEPELDHGLSTQLVQTAVAAIFFQIIRVRKVFQGHQWQGRTYHPDDPNNSYDAYINGSDFVPPRNELHFWYVPTRGVDERVDKLMNVLESCAKEPIEKGYLHKLQLCFHTADGSDISEDNLIEAYSLTFDYENGETSSQFSGRARDAQTQKMTTLLLSEGRQKLYDMVQKLLRLLYQTDRAGRSEQYPLPDNEAQFRLNILAEYNDSAPDGYQPPYFKVGDAGTIALLSLCNSDGEFSMNTGHHQIAAGLLLPGSPQSPVPRQQKPMNDNSIANSTSPTALGLIHSNQSLPQRISSSGLSSNIENGGTQREAVKKLQGVGFSRAPNSATQDTQRIEQFPSLPRQLTDVQHGALNAPPYTQYILNHLNGRLLEHSGNNSSGGDLDAPQGIGYEEDEAVGCSCGFQDVSGNMIHCVECRQLQHSQCYGYLNDTPPLHHICYKCLSVLYPEEKTQLDAAAQLSIRRFILHILLDQNAEVTYRSLADYLGRSVESIDPIMNVLEQSGLVQTSNRTQALHYQTIRYVGDEKSLRNEYSRPQKHINNLFAIPDAGELKTSNLCENSIPSSASSLTPGGVENTRFYPDESGQRAIIDDGTTQGEPSPQPTMHQTPVRLHIEPRRLRSTARRGLSPNPNSIVTPTSKRFAEFNSPVEAIKRAKTSKASPIFLQSTVSE